MHSTLGTVRFVCVVGRSAILDHVRLDFFDDPSLQRPVPLLYGERGIDPEAVAPASGGRRTRRPMPQTGRRSETPRREQRRLVQTLFSGA
jgi:hypothetical protein